MVINVRYNAICTDDESPHLFDTKMYLFHVEYHVRDAVTDLVACSPTLEIRPHARVQRKR